LVRGFLTAVGIILGRRKYYAANKPACPLTLGAGGLTLVAATGDLGLLWVNLAANFAEAFFVVALKNVGNFASTSALKVVTQMSTVVDVSFRENVFFNSCFRGLNEISRRGQA
jgi:hypothetical protein